MMKPKIRFNGFIDDWEQRKLGDILDVRSGRDYKHLLEGSIPVYGTGGYMLSVNEALSYDEDAIGIGRKGTIDKPYILKAPFWTVDTLFYAVPRHKTDLNFTFGIFQNIDWKKKDESTGVPSLSKTAINEIDILFPEYKEQQSIGRFFSNLDNLITLHQRKCDELKKLKKYMLQNMFPQNGENTPKIRFQGFINAWEQRKLGNMADIVGGGTPSTSISEFWDGDIDWYAPAEIADQIYLSSSQRKITEQGFNHSSTKMLPVGSVLFTSRAGIGKTAILSRQGCTNQGFQSIVPHKGELDSYFIFSRTEELKRYGETVGAGSTFVEVSSKQMANMELMMPKSLIEQKTIGEYFASIDNLITLHQRKVEQMKNLKKYMLQNMFPAEK
ncbi:restriction endonuclease subunit S [Amedibacterium intestinale]|uniref:restriction endonuclease subunit S n=1 Tax=Amedibacterium intestinale TaxID=2583452 RepID=UPI000E209CCB